jgi:hypothetical protein
MNETKVEQQFEKVADPTATNRRQNSQAKYYEDSIDDDEDREQHEGNKEINLHQIMDPDNQVLIEGVLFRARYLGSTQLVTDGNPTKLTRMLQAQEAVGRIKKKKKKKKKKIMTLTKRQINS